MRSDPGQGKVYLVGAGPGDPDLVTVRGLELIREADVIFYDNLASPSLLRHARPGAERIYVGKKRSDHARSQDEINELLVEHARRGRTVVRLKGGDPYIFGRGGEEAEALVDAGVRFEVVPGVSSATGVAAYAGFPLTHREHTSAVTFVTGHEAERIDWNRLGVAETLVLFMGLTSFGEIARRLIAAGRSAATPAAAVRWGTRPDQRVLTGTLGDLAERIASEDLRPPALVIVGEVVALRERLSWFERLPLFGRRVVVTRAAAQSEDFCRRLRRLGADAVELPVIEIRAPRDSRPIDEAITRLGEYDWLLFTSQNGVERFIERLDGSGRDLRDLRARICAIGPATAAAVRRLHLGVELTPERYVAEGVLEAFADVDLAGKRVLLPRARVARDVLPVEMAKRGARIDVVEAYETVRPDDAARRADEIFAGEARPDWITFTSSSTVENTLAVVGLEPLAGVKVASIGPVTTATARRLGLEVHAEAAEYTIDGLLAALAASS